MRPTEEEEIDRTRNAAAEREVIGTVIRSPVYADTAMTLRADDFVVANHQVIWRAIAHLLDRGDSIKLQTVLATCGNGLDGSGRRDLETMVQMAGGTAGILEEAMAATVDASHRRAVAAAYGQARRRAINSEDPIESTVARTSVEVDEAIHGEKTSYHDGHDVLSRLRSKLQKPPVPVPTGISKLDHVLEGGLMPTRMLAIVAQTKIGKTTLAATISHNVLTQAEPHLVISLERSETDIEQGCAARALGINALDLEQKFAQHEKAFDVYAADPRHSMRHYMHKPGATMEDIQQEIMRSHRAGAKGFILDYWQLIQRPPRESVQDHLSRCAQTLANLTAKLGMWSIVNAQSDAEGLPRECKALWLASPTLYVIRRDVSDKPDTWLQCLGSSYTKGLDAGGPQDPAMMLDTTVGPYFRSV